MSDSDSLKASSESIGSEDEAYSLVSSYDAEVASKHVDNQSDLAKRVNRFHQQNLHAMNKKETANFG